jgi:hypothetical protein
MEAAYIINKKDLTEVFKETMNDTLIDGFCNRFAGVMLLPQEVAKIHSVNKQTVISYIKDGLIEAEQEKKYGEYHIRMSDALRLDFKELRKNLKLK